VRSVSLATETFVSRATGSNGSPRNSRATTAILRRPGYKSRMAYSDAASFSLSPKDAAVVKAVREDRVPTPQQIHHVIDFITGPLCMSVHPHTAGLLLLRPAGLESLRPRQRASLTEQIVCYRQVVTALTPDEE
jgi:hypothetical protein